jgi:Lon protease-like protein
MQALKNYFKKKTIDADWSAINSMEDTQLITTLAMICPFSATEQQALLVANEIEDRAATMISLLEMASHQADGIEDVRH